MMNSAMFLIATLALCALPSALGLTCHHCMGNLTNPTKLCTTMEEYVNETCMGADAYCATTELQSNISVVKAYARGCVNEPHNCSSYEMSLCNNATMAASLLNLYLSTCKTACCNTSFCNAGPLPTMPPTESSTATDTGTGTGSTMATTTAAAYMFRPELIGILFIMLAAVYFGVQ